LVVVEDLDDGGRRAATDRVDGAQGRALHEARGQISTTVVAAGRGWYRNAGGARRGSRGSAAAPSDRTAGGCAVRPAAAEVRPWRGLGGGRQAGRGDTGGVAEEDKGAPGVRGRGSQGCTRHHNHDTQTYVG